MRSTKLALYPVCSHCGDAHENRVFADTGEEFSCWEHFGSENRAIMDLLDLTWGYSVVEDIMRILPNHYPPRPFRYDVVRVIEQFSQRSPEEIRQVLVEISDAIARAGDLTPPPV